MSSASNASFLTSKWKVPSFFLFLPRWHPLSPFRHHQKAEQDAENLKNGPLWAARGSADTIKEWYRLQIMHVSSLNLILCVRNRTAQRCTDDPQRPCMLNNTLALTDQGHLLTREMVKTGLKQELDTLSHSKVIKTRYDQLEQTYGICVQSTPDLCAPFIAAYCDCLYCSALGMLQFIKWNDKGESLWVSITLPLVISMSLLFTAEIKDHRDGGSHYLEKWFLFKHLITWCMVQHSRFSHKVKHIAGIATFLKW